MKTRPPHPPRDYEPARLRHPFSRAIPFVLWTLIAIQILAVCLMAAVPPVCRDSLSHHLAVPKLYLKHGGMVELPDIKYSYYPMNVTLLYTIPLYFGNDILPKYIHFLFALLTAWIVHRQVGRFLGSTHALLAALWFLSLPVIVKLSISVYVDLGLIFFTTASMIALLRWMEETEAIRWLIVSAVCCGLALGTKYNGLVAFLLLTFMTPLVYIRMSGKDDLKSSLRALQYGVLFAVVALLVFSPWMFRNHAWTRNPLHPLFQSVLEQRRTPRPAPADLRETDAPSEAAARRSAGGTSHLTLRSIIFGESGWEIALIPVRVFFHGRDDSPRYFDGRLNPLLFFLPFCAFLPAGRKSGFGTAPRFLLLAFAWLFLLIAFFQTDMRIRYILPIVPPLTILAAFGLQALFRSAEAVKQIRLNMAARTILAGLAALSLWYNFDYGVKLFRRVDPVGYIGGRVDRDAYIERFRPEYPLYRHVNAHLPETAKILGLFIGNRIYYSDREMVTRESIFRRMVQASGSPSDLVRELSRQGFSHIMVKHDIFTEWGGHVFDENRRVLINAFFADRADLLMFSGGAGLYRIRADDFEAPAPDADFFLESSPH